MLIVAWILAGASQAVTPPPTIEVKTPKDVALVVSVKDPMTALSQKVTACVERGGKAETCQCQDPADLAALRKAYRTLIEQRPEWKDQQLSYQYMNNEKRNISGTLVMSNLRRQLDALKCE